MVRKLFYAFLLAMISGAAYWYYVAKEQDFRISFQTSAPSHVVNQALYQWEADHPSVELVKDTEDSLIMKSEESLLSWSTLSAGDSVTTVILSVRKLKNNFIERTELLLGQSQNRKQHYQLAEEFKTNLDEGFFPFRLNIIGFGETPESTCACLSLTSTDEEKAFSMMANIDILSQFFLEENLEMLGKPRIIVNNWKPSTGLLQFDFCFPVAGPIPDHPEIHLKKFPSTQALVAEYFGNYMYSHQAWPLILHFADQQNISLKAEAQEIFFDNPEMGGTGKNWKAEIYFPLAQD